MTRFIIDVSESGEIITLENGLRYEVAPDDLPTSALWYGSQQVRIVPSRSKIFPIRLYNDSTGDFVKAMRFIEPEAAK